MASGAVVAGGTAAFGTSCAHAQPGPRPAHIDGDDKPLVLGYFPDWTPLKPDRLNMAQFTHIAHAFAGAKLGGVLGFPPDGQSQKLIDSAHAKGVKVILSLGGADSNGSLKIQDTNMLADGLVAHIKQFQYDGVDVDWEAPENDDDAAKMSALVQALRQRLPKTLITMAVPASDWSGKWYHTPDLLPHVDWLNIMTYDFAGPWSDVAGHNAPVPDVTKAIDYWTGKGWPGSKLMLGIPAYGRRMKAKHFGDPAPKGTYVGDEISYNDIRKMVQGGGWNQRIDSDAQVPYLINTDGNQLISFDDTDSAHTKGALAHDRELKGFFFWEITEDFDGSVNVLVRAATAGWTGRASS